MRKQAVQYTIRGVPREVDRELRQKASQRKLSLNQVILDELTQATVGRWSPDAAFDEILAARRKIDRDKWK